MNLTCASCPDKPTGVKADSMIRLFMTEYQTRLERNIAHVAALFRWGVRMHIQIYE